MEDLYKNNPNSWLWRANCSRTIYHRPDLSQVPITVFTKPTLGSSNPKPNQISGHERPVSENLKMKDLYKTDPNSWLRRTNFSRTVCHRLDLTQVPISIIPNLKHESSNPKPNQSAISIPVGPNNTVKTNKTDTASKDEPNHLLRGSRSILSHNANQDAITIPITRENTSKTSQLASNLKSNPYSTFTSEVHGQSDFKKNITDATSKHWAIYGMHKKVTEDARKPFRAPASRERTGAKTVKSFSRPKKESSWKAYWKCEPAGCYYKYFSREVCQVNALEKSSDVL